MDHNLICIQQALEQLAGFQGYESAAVGSLNRLRGERDRYEAAIQDALIAVRDGRLDQVEIILAAALR